MKILNCIRALFSTNTNILWVRSYFQQKIFWALFSTNTNILWVRSYYNSFYNNIILTNYKIWELTSIQAMLTLLFDFGKILSKVTVN